MEIAKNIFPFPKGIECTFKYVGNKVTLSMMESKFPLYPLAPFSFTIYFIEKKTNSQ